MRRVRFRSVREAERDFAAFCAAWTPEQERAVREAGEVRSEAAEEARLEAERECALKRQRAQAQGAIKRNP